VFSALTTTCFKGVLCASLGTAADLHGHPSDVICVHNTGWLAVSCDPTFFCSDVFLTFCFQAVSVHAGFEVLTAVIKDNTLLGYNAVQSVESQPTFRMNISPPTSGSKNKPSFPLSGFILRPQRWRRHALPKRPLTFNGLYGDIAQKIVRFTFGSLFFRAREHFPQPYQTINNIIYRVIRKSVKHLKNSQQINYATGHDNSYYNIERNTSIIFKESPRAELPCFAARKQQYHRCCGSVRP
jgi:hypothetical protein